MARLEKGILKDPLTGKQFFPQTSAEFVEMSDGRSVEEIIGEKDNFTPTITQRNTMSQVGVDSTINVHTSVQEGLLESATLKGQTLVNAIIGGNKSWDISGQYLTQIVKGNIEANQKYFFKIYNYIPNSSFCIVNSRSVSEVVISYTQSGVSSGVVTTNNIEIINDNLKPHIRVDGTLPSNLNELAKNVRVVLIKYQEGMENWGIPYFTGMASVVNPSVTSVGKNLFDGVVKIGDIYNVDGSELPSNTNHTISTNYNPIEPNQSFILTYTKPSVSNWCAIYEYDENKVFIKATDKNTFTTSSRTKFIKFKIHNPNQELINNIQLEKGTTSTEYEPYKSNTVTPTEEVILRSLPNGVCDTLNLITGEYVQRVTEVTFSNTSFSNWQSATTEIGDYIRFSQDLIGNKKTSSVIANYYVRKYPSEGHGEYEYVFILENTLYFQVKKERLSTLDKSGLLTYLASNPLTLQYELATPIVKTVDLTGSPFSYKNGHIILSSDSLLPTYEYQAVTSLSGQVTQNTKLLIKHNTQIFNLEMLLITSLVESDYQRLIMQNGSSVASLRTTETYQSNGLRYYMLSRLIEEGMYNEEDIMNKLDVFLMYGDITDLEYTTLVESILGVSESEDEDIESDVRPITE